MLRLPRVTRWAPSTLVVGVCSLSVFTALQACGGAILDEGRDRSGGDDDMCWYSGGRGSGGGGWYPCPSQSGRGSGSSRGGSGGGGRGGNGGSCRFGC